MNTTGALIHYDGVVARGHRIASGQSVGEGTHPFPIGSLVAQAPYFDRAGFSLEQEVPGLFWGSINVSLNQALALDQPDATVRDVDWTAALPQAARIAPETFSFVRSCLVHNGQRFYAGVVYYPHPETKPVAVNGHDPRVLEVLAPKILGLAYGDVVTVICRRNAFRPA